MKNINQIRDTKVIIEENVEAEERKLSALVRAGLFDAKKLPALKRAMEKSADKMTAQEKRMLINLLDNLINQVISNQSVYQKVKQNVMKEDYEYLDEVKEFTSKDINDLPNIILLRRRAVRVFPDGQKVVMYWADKINRYIPIPVSASGVSLTEATPTLSDLHNEYLDHIKAAASHEDEDHPDVAVHLDRAEKVLKDIKNNFGRENKIRTQAIGKQVHKKATQVRDYKLGQKMRGEKGILATAGKMFSSGQRAAGLGTLVGGTIGAGARALVKNLTTEGIETTRIRMKKIRVSPLRGVIKKSSNSTMEEELDENAIVKGIVAGGSLIAKQATKQGKQLFTKGKKALDDFLTKRDAAKQVTAASKEATRARKQAAIDTLKRIRSKNRNAFRSRKVRFKKVDKDGNGSITRTAATAAGIGSALTGGSSRSNASYTNKRRELERLQGQNSFANAIRNTRGDFDTRSTADAQRARKFASAVPGPTSESNITILKNLKEGNETVLHFRDDTELLVSHGLAQKIINIYESINKNNRQLMTNMLHESVDSFKKVSNFAISNNMK